MTVDLLAFGAHPDDVEIGCGGTLALVARTGRRVGIVHLSRGERGTRGSAAVREREARAAAECLRVHEVNFLDCGDGGMRAGQAEEDAVIAVLRTLRPAIVLLPPAADRHPDHGRAHRLVADACFYAGLVKRVPAGLPAAPNGQPLLPYRPAALFAYELNDPIAPTVIVDVTASFGDKQRALDQYRSQLHQPATPNHPAPDDAAAEPATRIASPLFREAIAARARHHGMHIGVAYGEPLRACAPLPVADLFSLCPSPGAGGGP